MLKVAFTPPRLMKMPLSFQTPEYSNCGTAVDCLNIRHRCSETSRHSRLLSKWKRKVNLHEKNRFADNT
jgi:hypothetical protein